MRGKNKICTKRLVITIRSSLSLKNIYKHKKHDNFLQAYLHDIQTYNFNKVIKKFKLWKLGLIVGSCHLELKEIMPRTGI